MYTSVVPSRLVLLWAFSFSCTSVARSRAEVTMTAFWNCAGRRSRRRREPSHAMGVKRHAVYIRQPLQPDQGSLLTLDLRLTSLLAGCERSATSLRGLQFLPDCALGRLGVPLEFPDEPGELGVRSPGVPSTSGKALLQRRPRPLLQPIGEFRPLSAAEVPGRVSQLVPQQLGVALILRESHEGDDLVSPGRHRVGGCFVNRPEVQDQDGLVRPALDID